jgi:DNA replicative helicase MCM subunit Mcm2 (Cdc46/Mcm family)
MCLLSIQLVHLRYVAYARARCQPVLSEGAHARLVNSYVKFRGDMRKEAVCGLFVHNVNVPWS